MDIQTKDGILLRGIPDGTPDDAIKARIEKIRAERGTPAPTPFVPSGEKETPSWTDPDVIAGNPVTRFAIGAAKPILGAVQLGENINPVSKFLGTDKLVNEHLAQLEEMTQSGRKKLGSEGFDFTETAGTILSPVSLKAMKMPAGKTAGERIRQGVALGGGFGATTPVTHGDDFLGSKAVQTVTGAILGGVIPGAIELGRKGGTVVRNLIDPWLPGGVDRAAGRTANEAAGAKRDAVIAALEQNRQLVPGSKPTAGEAAAPVGSAEFSGLQRVVEGRRPSSYEALRGSQEAARKSAIQKIGGSADDLAGAVKAREETAREMYGAVRNDRIGPESNAEIMERAIRAREASKAAALQDQGRFATTAAQQDELAGKFVPVPGQPRVSGRLSANAERVPEAKSAAEAASGIASTRRAEEEFLENTMELLRETVGMESRSLTALLRRPSMRSALQDAIKSARETDAYFPKKSGDKFSVQNLQRIKESLDAGIRAAKASADAGKRPELSPSELEGTRKAFVDWLSSRSPGWKAARLQFAEDSIPINRMQVGQELEKALTNSLGTAERPTAFATAVREAPRTIKRATGTPRFERLDDVLAPNQVQSVNSVLDDLARTAKHEQLAKAGTEKARDLVGQVAPAAPAAGMFNPKYSVARAILNRIAGRVEGKSVDRLSEAMENPEVMARLMRSATPSERAQIINALLSQKVSRGAVVYGTQGAAEQEQF